jgi:hypothetical protein
MRPLLTLMSEQIALHASRREDRVATDPVRLGTGSARPRAAWLGRRCCGEARGCACTASRRGDLTNLTQGFPPWFLHSPARLKPRLWRRRMESSAGRQFPGLLAGGLTQAQRLKVDKLLPIAAIDEQRRRLFATGEVERAALIAVETSGLSRVEHEANACRRA